MDGAEYAGVQDHLDRLIGSVRAELEREKGELARLGRHEWSRTFPRLLIVDLVLANVLLWLVLSEYAIYWITASFFLYVVYPFLFLVPSSAATQSDDNGVTRPSERVGENDIAEHRWAIARIFWNSFFINSQPLAPAFVPVYTLNILFALARGTDLTGWLVLFQSAAILVFYIAIAVFKPYTGQFQDSVLGLQSSVVSRIRRRIEPLWKVILPVGLAAGAVAIVLIAAMLLPGFTLGVIWNSEATVRGLGFLPVLFVLASQVVLVRVVQGAASRRLVRQLRERKIGILEQDVLGLLEAHRSRVAKGVPGALDRFAQDFAGIRAAFISSRVYRMQVQDLAGILPIHVVVPDLDLILNRETIQVLGDQPDSRQIL